MPNSKFSDPAEVGNIFAHDVAKSGVRRTPLHDLPRRKYTLTVSIQQQNQHHPRMKGRLTTIVTGVVGNDRRYIGLRGHIQ